MTLVKYISTNYENKFNEFSNEINQQREEFLKEFPLERIKELTIQEFNNRTKYSFMGKLGTSTNAIGGTIRHFSNTLISYNTKTQRIELHSALKNTKKLDNLNEFEELFELIRRDIYDFVNSFSFENYESSKLLENQNYLKFKLLRLYKKDLTLFGTTSIEAIKRIFSNLEESELIKDEKIDDVISGSITLTKYLIEKLPNYRDLDTDVVNHLIWDYSNELLNNNLVDSSETVDLIKENKEKEINDSLRNNNYSEKELSIYDQLLLFLENKHSTYSYDSYKSYINKIVEKANKLELIKSLDPSKLNIGDIENMIENEGKIKEHLSQDNHGSGFQALRDFLENRQENYNKDESSKTAGEYKAYSEVPIIEKGEIITDSYIKTDGEFIIYSGVPGCGKSYALNQEVDKLKVRDENVIRTTFYPDYSYTDFIGQIIPSIKDGQIKYVFNPGPFALALLQSHKRKNEVIFLIIEEINRGNASSIFGDIFQLLDRNFESKESTFSIYNLQLQNYLNEYLGLSEGKLIEKIRIPSNLALYGTMNTSDQNVFTLDNAFKRRVNIKRLSNDSCVYGEKYVPGIGTQWEKFVKVINEHIVSESGRFIKEDKQLGMYFFREEDLCDNGNCEGEPKDELDIKIERFANKLFDYLWNDVAFMDRDHWFNNDYKTLDEIIKTFISNTDNRLVVFSGQLLGKFNDLNVNNDER